MQSQRLPLKKKHLNISFNSYNSFMNIYDFLNRRYSLRNLTDEEFENHVNELAEQLEEVDYRYSYTNEELAQDWFKLNKKKFNDDTSSTTRTGMKLCEHFFPNFFDISNQQGQSFSTLWKKENLIKILRWNRKSHSTPYISELRRGLYFCCGLTKNTMYRPHLAKTICTDLKAKVILDPCCGWGGRLLGVVASGAYYYGFEPNPTTYENLIKLINFLGIREQVTIINDVVENINNYEIPNVDLVLTSPPYFNLEIYSTKGSETKYSTYEEWRDEWLSNIINLCLQKTTYSAWNVHNIGKLKIISDIKNIHEQHCFNEIKTFSVSSSKRQTNEKGKNIDKTIVYGRGPARRGACLENK
jgi:16S rRNA G966 N2-methylase RsmD